MSREFFETIKIIDGVVQNLFYHQKRFDSVLRHFGSVYRYDLTALINPPRDGLLRCKIIYKILQSGECIFDISYFDYKKRDIKSVKLVYDDDIEYGLKSTNRDVLDLVFAQKEKCDDVLVVKNGLVTDTTIANIAFYDGLHWVTPRKPLLMGTTRDRLLESGEIREADICVRELCGFKKVALINAMIGFDIISENVKDFIC